MSEQPTPAGAPPGAELDPKAPPAPPATKSRDRSAPPADPKPGDEVSVSLLMQGPRSVRVPGLVKAAKKVPGRRGLVLDVEVSLPDGKQSTLLGVVPEPDSGASLDNTACQWPCWGRSSDA